MQRASLTSTELLPDRPMLPSPLGAALMLMAAVFVACLFGIYSRPVGFLANIWPANAIMLGILLRVPAAATPLGWLCGAIGFVAADLLTGASLIKALLLNGANLVGIAVAYAALTRAPAGTIELRQPASMLLLVLAAAAGGAVAGLVGGIANPVLFGRGIFHGWTFWFATEFVNYITILPVILSAPPLAKLLLDRRRPAMPSISSVLPAATLLLSFLVAAVVGGPGAIAFPVPALLWCSLVYPVFTTTVLTLLFGLWTMIVLAAGHVPRIAGDEMTLASIRLGASLVAIVPIALSSVMQSRNALLADLHHMATHDRMTGVANRGAFIERASELIASSRSFALLMIDLDHFKAINDTYGHAGGDEVLVAFARRAQEALRANDLIGRLGGEEFAVLICDRSEEEAARIAERLRLAIAGTPIPLSDDQEVAASVSIGMVTGTRSDAREVDLLLREADDALYRAKKDGRNRLAIAKDATLKMLTPHASG